MDILMGVGPVAMLVYDTLQCLRPGKSMCELGSQDMAITGFSCSARDYMTRLGMRYECIDIDGDNGAVIHDFNGPPSPAVRGMGTFDIVTNHGTSEHVFNQLEVFRLMHDLTSVGGIMVNVVPAAGYPGHGMFLYDQRMFHLLANANGYPVLYDQAHQDHMGYLAAVVFQKINDHEFIIPMDLRP